jgi:hypothetical protein
VILQRFAAKGERGMPGTAYSCTGFASNTVLTAAINTLMEKKMKSPHLRRLLFAGLSSLVLVASGSAHALFRTYLSVNGNDANACTVVAPCRLLPAALAATDAGGEVWIVDSANYNTSTVSITKSVTILAIPGALGSVVGNNGTAFSISGTGIDVTLQNLNIMRLATATGDIGILIGNAGKVNVINCTISGFIGNGSNGLGIWVNPGANAPKVNVVGSVIRNNANGIVVGGNGRATISKTHILGNSGIGVASSSGTGISVVHVSDSVSSGNAAGFVASGSSGAFNSYMFITRSVATENVGSGFQTDGGITAYMVVDDSIATNNLTGFNNAAGTLTFQSRGNNTVTANGTNTTGTITFQAGV